MFRELMVSNQNKSIKVKRMQVRTEARRLPRIIADNGVDVQDRAGGQVQPPVLSQRPGASFSMRKRLGFV